VNGQTQPFKKVFSTQSANDFLKRMADGDLKEFGRYSYSPEVTVQQKQLGESQLRICNYRTVEKEVITSQKTSHWLMCYKSVQRINVAQPSEISNKTKSQTSIHELLSRYQAYT
jgi:hypothetical protein